MPDRMNMLVFPSEEPTTVVWDQSHAPRAMMGHLDWPKGLFVPFRGH